jgi:hypothetical protein
MQISRIKIAEAVMAGLIVFLLSGSAVFYFLQSKSLHQGLVAEMKRQLPKSPFTFPEAAYAKMGDPHLYLKFVPPRIHLPDLRNTLTYYGENKRPDAMLGNPKIHFGMQGGKSIVAALEGEKQYLIYDTKLPVSCKITFSPNNDPSMLWFTASTESKEAGQAEITLFMQDMDGQIVSGSDPHGHFSLQGKESHRTHSQNSWEIGSWKVDGTLLSRQKTKWVGQDRFLENHGGDEFLDFTGKNRLDFGDGEELYSVFVKLGDCLVWDENKWSECGPSQKTLDKPLLVVKKIDERVMMFELWDVEGKEKVAMSLVKAPETFRHDHIVRDFKFVGARTKTQVVFQIEDERLIVKPHDWLLLTTEGWKKLKTAREIDDYVNRKLVGPLFIFEEISKRDERPVLIGTLYNPNRTESHFIEVAMMPIQNGLQTPMERHNMENKIQAATPLATH